MKILFLMTLIGENTGVPDKVYAMLTTMESLGHDAAFLPVGYYTNGESNRFERFLVHSFKQNDYLLKGFRKIIRYIEIVKKFKPDVVYYRYDVRVSDWLVLLLVNTRYIVEHNAIEYHELINAGLKGAALKDRYLGWIVRMFSSGLVSVTREILNYQLSLFPFNKKKIVISNSIDLSVYSTYKKSFTNTKRLVMVSNFENWQGLDRIVELMGHDKMKEFTLVVVGSGVEYDKYSLSAKHRNVEFAGTLFGDDLLKLMLSCDVGVGSLATFRKGIYEACPLKTRLYLAVGLPILIGYGDPDISDSLPFVFKVSNNNRKIPVDGFINFYRSLDSLKSGSVREFAESKLSISNKMEQLINFIAVEIC